MAQAEKIKQAQEVLTAAREAVNRIETALQQAQDEISPAEVQISQLEGQLPALAAQLMLGEIEQSAIENHLAELEKLKRQVTVYTAALTGLDPIYQAACETRKTAEKALSNHMHWHRFEELRTQLLQAYDEKTLAEARRVANNIDRHGPAIHAYGALVKELRKLNPRLDISY